MTGCASEASEGGLCLGSYPWKNPETLFLNSQMIYDIVIFMSERVKKAEGLVDRLSAKTTFE